MWMWIYTPRHPLSIVSIHDQKGCHPSFQLISGDSWRHLDPKASSAGDADGQPNFPQETRVPRDGLVAAYNALIFILIVFNFSSVQLLSRVWLYATPWTAAHQASLSITNSRSLPKPMSIESVTASNHLILCHPLLLLPSIVPSIRVFSNESALCIRWPKYWSFSFNISPSNEHLGLISFRMDWLDLLAVQGTLKSLFQHHSSKASTLWHSAFFTLQL